jgi:hypothetical protein
VNVSSLHANYSSGSVEGRKCLDLRTTVGLKEGDCCRFLLKCVCVNLQCFNLHAVQNVCNNVCPGSCTDRAQPVF